MRGDALGRRGSPLNAAHDPIVLSVEREDDVTVIAELLEVMPHDDVHE